MSDTEQITEESGVHKAWISEAKQIKTTEELVTFLNRLVTAYTHDYGTIVHACVAAMVAAFSFINKSDQGGITGFQAGAIGWEMIKEFMGINGPAKIVDYENLLYPQYDYKFEKTISKDTWDYIVEKAKQKLAEDNEHTHLDVLAHWQSIADGRIPFGFTLRDD